MKPRNIVSVFQGDAAVEKAGMDPDKSFISLKKHEIRNMRSFYEIMSSFGCRLNDFDGFFVSYSIAQIGKEFDLLRFGTEYVLNIEIKSELKVAQKEQKILKQMRINHYYLKFLGMPIRIFTYVENDGFYKYCIETDNIEKVSPQIIEACMTGQAVNYSIDPDKEFIPSSYLISPFNSTSAFVTGEYFLTTAQQKIKDEINEELLLHPFMFFAISANAGTGKTLLMYDMAKGYIQSGKRVKIIHCGILNDGHHRLIEDYGWNITSIRNISSNKEYINLENISIIFVDESQRIRLPQINALISKAVDEKIPIVFSFDTKQYLRTGENLDLGEYLKAGFPDVKLSIKKLTNKIRTNKAMASFITNLFDIGKSHDNLNYECVTIDYFDNLETVKEYMSFLKKSGWTAITFTTSTINPDPYDDLIEIAEKNAHGVIGQEFSKVVFVMDKNFKYSEAGKLSARQSYYSASGMLYQIVTRVVDELKIVVLDNPELYVKLLEIKRMGT